MHEQLKALIDTAWESVKPEKRSEDNLFGGDAPPEFLEDEPFWSWELTSPLPAFWPPSKNLALYYYAYATGLDLAGNLNDGVYVASPWARIEVMPKSDSLPKLTWLRDTLVELGIQGFSPLTAAEESLYKMWPRERVVNFLTQFHAAQRVNETSMIEFKKFFCMLMSHNSIYEELRSRHETFYRWLDCKHADAKSVPEFWVSEIKLPPVR